MKITHSLITVGGRRAPDAHGLYELEKVVQKPTPAQVEQELIVPGLRAGHYSDGRRAP